MEKKSIFKTILEFLITTLNGMAYGLFATLIIGTIISTIGGLFNETFFLNSLLKDSGKCLQWITGAGIGAGIALALKFDTFKTIVLASVGEIAAYLSGGITSTGVTFTNGFKIGDPLTIYFVVIFTALLVKLVLKKKTPVDILIIPLFSVIIGITLTMLLRYPTIYATKGIQDFINVSTSFAPIPMSIIIAVVMGMALTAPISSAAIAAVLFTVPSGETLKEGLAMATGAACIGCCTQMVGFAIQSIRDNKIGMVISIGIGTSMLQFKNILKKPIVWLPTIIASAILGPIATSSFVNLQCFGSSAGMGTSGLVGQIGTLSTMGSGWQTWLIIILLQIIAPAILVFVIDLIFRRFKLIKDGDLIV